VMFESGAGHDAARLEDYLRAVRDHMWVVLVAVVLCAGLAWFAADSRTDSFTATARVAVGPTPVGAANPGGLQRPNLELERSVVESNEIAATSIARHDLSLSVDDLLDGLTVEYLPDSDVLDVRFTSTDPETAARYANAIAETYVDARDGASLAFYETQLSELQRQEGELSEALEQLYGRITDIELQRGALLANGAVEELAQLELQQLTDELTFVRDLVSQSLAQQRAISAGVLSARQDLTRRSPAATLLRTASPPTSPDGIGTGVLTLGGAVLGLLLGFGGAFLLQRLDKTATTEADVNDALGTTVLGTVPKLGRWRSREDLVLLSDERSSGVVAAQEAFRRLATTVQFLRSSQGIRSLLVTSATPGEGKSTTAANLGVALAQGGSRIALVSADLRRPSQEARFGVAASPGLSEFLANEAELVAHEVPDVPGLWIIPAGAPPRNPGELLGSDAFGKLIADITVDIDLIIVDTPPILNAADASAAVRHVDGALVVVDTRRTELSDLVRARASLERSGGRVMGAVMNRDRWNRRFFGKSRYQVYDPPSP
jgi:capsular exopolysaccharide synthesis family protein